MGFSRSLDIPLNDVICAGAAKGTGKSFWIVLKVIRDAQIIGANYHCLITRSSFQALQELQGLLYRYLVQAYWRHMEQHESIFRLGGKQAPFGTVELAYTAGGPLEQIRALARLQGRSKTCLIHDEAGVQPSPVSMTSSRVCCVPQLVCPLRWSSSATPAGQATHG